MGPQTVVKQGNTRPKTAHRRLAVVMSERLILPHEEKQDFSWRPHPCSDDIDTELMNFCGASQIRDVSIYF